MIKGLILSLQFLTRIPINIPVDFNEENLRKSTFFFPLVGVILGGLSGLVYYLFSFINIELASLLTVIAMIFFTGGLHLDGIADMFDGFMANKDKEITLEIMKDSRIGTFGAVALILIIFSKYIVISNLRLNIPLILILSMANSRIVVGHKMIYKKIARPGGLGDMFHRSNPKKYALSGAVLYIAIILLLKPLYLIPLFTTIVAGEIISSITYKKIDGFTGDIYGATIEIGEIVSLITFMGVSIWI
jgi:adenosylcobinamide-GDP ribazoletransferase